MVRVWKSTAYGTEPVVSFRHLRDSFPPMTLAYDIVSFSETLDAFHGVREDMMLAGCCL